MGQKQSSPSFLQRLRKIFRRPSSRSLLEDKSYTMQSPMSSSMSSSSSSSSSDFEYLEYLEELLKEYGPIFGPLLLKSKFIKKNFPRLKELMELIPKGNDGLQKEKFGKRKKMKKRRSKNVIHKRITSGGKRRRSAPRKKFSGSLR